MSNLSRYFNIVRRAESTVFNLLNINSRRFSSSSAQLTEFNIPKYIPRSSTDILAALDSTVKRDKGAPHYSFHDDPYLTPLDNFNKRNFALSKESGRRTAMWIKDSNPHLFISKADDPVIKPFNCAETYNEESEVSEDLIKELIDTKRVTDAVTVYELCTQKEIAISDATKQSLLEFLCFSNGEDFLSEEFFEEKHYTRKDRPGQSKQNTWRSDSLAEELFLAQENPTTESYNAIIRGMAMHNHVDGAWEYYKAALEKNIPVDLATLNSLIPTVVILQDSHENRWDAVTKILSSIAKRGMTPNLQTLNNCLQVLGVSGSFRKAKGFSLQLISEMSLQGVKPSLASYYFLLLIFYRRRGPITNILHQMLDTLEQEESLPVLDQNDYLFFTQAMEVCCSNLRCFETAKRLQALLETKDNVKFMSCNLYVNIYYRNYLNLAVKSLSTQEFMKFYNEYVPHIHAPDFDTMESIVMSIAALGSFEYLPTLWTDMVAMNMLNNSKVIDALLITLCQYVPSEEEKSYQSQQRVLGNEFTESVGLMEQIARIPAYLIGEMVDGTSRQKWTGQQLGQILQIIANCGGIEETDKLFSALKSNSNLVVGEIPPEVLHYFTSSALKGGYVDAALNSAIYCKAYDLTTARKMAKEIAQSESLLTRQRAKLTIEFGTNIVDVNNTDDQ